MVLGAGNEVAFEGFHISALFSDEKSVKRTHYCAICLFRNRAFSLSQFIDAFGFTTLSIGFKIFRDFLGGPRIY